MHDIVRLREKLKKFEMLTELPREDDVVLMEFGTFKEIQGLLKEAEYVLTLVGFPGPFEQRPNDRQIRDMARSLTGKPSVNEAIAAMGRADYP